MHNLISLIQVSIPDPGAKLVAPRSSHPPVSATDRHKQSYLIFLQGMYWGFEASDSDPLNHLLSPQELVIRV